MKDKTNGGLWSREKRLVVGEGGVDGEVLPQQG